MSQQNPTDRRYRYPGTQPFGDSPEDRKLFFGRRKEEELLFQTILRDELTVLTGRSGLGKSSLLRAAIFPRLREEGYVPMTVRFHLSEAELEEVLGRKPTIVDVLTAQFQDDCKGLELKEGDRSSLWAYLKSSEIWSQEDELLTPVLVLDQFEEVFTRLSDQSRKAILSELAPVLSKEVPPSLRQRFASDDPPPFSKTAPQVRVVIGMREEFISRLKDFKRMLPGIDNLIVLRPLDYEAAKAAIIEPASVEGDEFAVPPFDYNEAEVDGVLELLAFSDLRKHEEWANQEGDAWREFAEIEPFQLQIICQGIERKMEWVHQQHPKLRRLLVPREFLDGPKGFAAAVNDYYEESLASLDPPVAQKVQQFFESGLLTPDERRQSQPVQTIRRDFGIDEPTLRRLEAMRLVRHDSVRGKDFYELSHDCLIPPVVAARVDPPLVSRKFKVIFGLVSLGAVIFAGLAILFYVLFTTAEAAKEKVRIAHKSEEKLRIEAQVLRDQAIEAQKKAESQAEKARKAQSEAEIAKADVARISQRLNEAIENTENQLNEARREAKLEKERLIGQNAQLQAENLRLKLQGSSTVTQVETLENYEKPLREARSAEDENRWSDAVEKYLGAFEVAGRGLGNALAIAKIDTSPESAGKVRAWSARTIEAYTAAERIRHSRFGQVGSVEARASAILFQLNSVPGDPDWVPLHRLRIQIEQLRAASVMSPEDFDTSFSQQSFGIIQRSLTATYWERLENFRRPETGFEPTGDPAKDIADLEREFHADVILFDSWRNRWEAIRDADFALFEQNQQMLQRLIVNAPEKRLVDVHTALINNRRAHLAKLTLKERTSEITDAMAEAARAELDAASTEARKLSRKPAGIEFDMLIDLRRLQLENTEVVRSRETTKNVVRSHLRIPKEKGYLAQNPNSLSVAGRVALIELLRWRAMLKQLDDVDDEKSIVPDADAVRAFVAALNEFRQLGENGILDAEVYDRFADVLAPHTEPERVRASHDTLTYRNSLGLDFVRIPGKTAMIGLTEITFATYRKFAEDEPDKATVNNATGWSGNPNDWQAHEPKGLSWEDFEKEAKKLFPEDWKQHPVTGVGFEQARAFCEWISKKDQLVYRLPKDAFEWELVAVAGMDAETAQAPVYPWSTAVTVQLSNGITNLGGLEFGVPPGRVDDNKNIQLLGYRDGFVRTAPVTQFPPNKLGMYGVGGNVREWCIGDTKLYESSLLRGGSWIDSDIEWIALTKVSNRADRIGTAFIGFRVVIDLDGDFARDKPGDSEANELQ